MQSNGANNGVSSYALQTVLIAAHADGGQASIRAMCTVCVCDSDDRTIMQLFLLFYAPDDDDDDNDAVVAADVVFVVFNESQNNMNFNIFLIDKLLLFICVIIVVAGERQADERHALTNFLLVVDLHRVAQAQFTILNEYARNKLMKNEDIKYLLRAQRRTHCV